MAIFYHYQFRTKKSLELPLDWLETGPYLRQAPNKAEIRRIGQQLLDARKEACKCLLQHAHADVNVTIVPLTRNRPEPPIFEERQRLSPVRARGEPRAEEVECSQANCQGRLKV